MERLSIILILGLTSVLANWVAFLLRFDFDVADVYFQQFRQGLSSFVLIQMAALGLSGFWHGWWRSVGIRDIAALFAVLVGSVILFGGWIYLGPMAVQGYPRGVLLLSVFSSAAFFIPLRMAYRMKQEIRRIQSGRHVVCIGNVDAVLPLIRALKADQGMNPKLILTDEHQWFDTKLEDVRIRGPVRDWLNRVSWDHVSDLIVDAEFAPSLRELLDRIPQHVRLLKLPSLGKFLRGSVLSKAALRPFSMEDLLSRQSQAGGDPRVRELISGKTVLVTGAGGSIGSELVRQIARQEPKKLILIDHNETNLFEILREVPGAVGKLRDIRDRSEIKDIFDEFRPEVVFHAAAFKHVGMMECEPDLAIENNFHGTLGLIQESERIGVGTFVTISTDKAVRPSGMMGFSKRLAELVTLEANSRGRGHFTVVRFGNVLGSSGSVVPIFSRQIQDGGPVTVTDPEATRFLMTIPEAVTLVLKAAVEKLSLGELVLLKMGEPVQIIRLAETMIRLAGFRPYEDIPIKLVGLRSGEKMHEELFDPSLETVSRETNDLIIVNSPVVSSQELQEWIRTVKIPDLLKKSELKRYVGIADIKANQV